ncbi:ODV-e66 [Artaxa digramma nucleopolyhedrovirus]|uniref:ODV-e66 n=1 Tax=Artaxa digramma nucleopolyhedrovirus TaxID=3070910 RepID=A0AAE6R6R8_9ABAC|nr:ODV-e66 [Euproctis digramma nucleopolyhedrovirus]QHB21800.1 ODV-e66 [Artaxa digramma nucleopolyhedrovirus]
MNKRYKNFIMGASISKAYDDSGAYDNININNSRFKNDLDLFEFYYVDTLQEKFLQKAEKILNPTVAFSNTDNVFVGLEPWTNVSHFGTFCHTMIGYGVRFRNPSDTLYLNAQLAYNLRFGLLKLYEHLPFPAPVNQAPWGAQADWYHFSITMPECVQNTCTVLRNIYYDLDDVCIDILNTYLPAPTFSMGWRRTAGNAMRMCLPYAYGQLLQGFSFIEIAAQPEVQYVLNLIAFALVPSGNGIHLDYAYFDHTDVRAYGYLINSYFTFSYYNFLFGNSTVNMNNLYHSISLVSNKRGLANPAVMSRNGSHFSNVMGYFIQYPDTVVSGDFSKILTIRNSRYFGSVVGQAPGVAYYEADPTNQYHAPLWTMTRKIWANDGAIVRYRPEMLGLESGVILNNNLNGVVAIPTTTTSTSSFHPAFASTGICATSNAGVLVMHVRLEELNLEFYNYTLYHRYGMFQLYDKIYTLTPINFNARCVVLTRDTTQDTTEPKWTIASNSKTFNRVTTKHHNISNMPNLPNFSLRLFDNGMQTIEQIVSADSINAGVGTTCFSLLCQNYAETDTTTATNTGDNSFVINTNQNSIQCSIVFPIVVLKDVESRQVVINDASAASDTNLHTLRFDKISKALSQLSLSVNNLDSHYITKTNDSFVFENNHSNQFKFTY